MAILLLAGALAAARDAPTPQDGDLVSARARIGRLIADGRYTEACRLARSTLHRALRSRPNDPEAASLRDLLVEGLWRDGRATDRETVALARQAVASRQDSATANNDAGRAAALSNLGRILLLGGRYAEARETFEQALNLAEALTPAVGPIVADALQGLGDCDVALGKVRESDLYTRALRIRQETFGPESREAAESLQAIGTLRHQSGDYPGALQALERAVAIWEAVGGPDHPRLAEALGRLSNLETSRGQRDRARNLGTRALEIQEKRLPPDHPEIATTLTILAIPEALLGHMHASRTMAVRALNIQKESLGPAHPDIAATLLLLAALDNEAGDNVAARREAEEGLAMQQATLPPDHPAFAAAYNVFISVLFDTGDRVGGLRSAQRTAAIQERALGPEHPALGYTLMQIGVIATETRDYQTAREALERSVTIYEKAYGTLDGAVTTPLWSLARLQLLDAGPAEAYATAMRTERLSMWNFASRIRGLPEDEALAVSARRTSGLDLAASALLALDPAHRPAESEVDLWTAVLRSRTLVLDDMVRRRRALHDSVPQSVRPYTDAYAAAREALARVLIGGSATRGPQGYRAAVDDASRDLLRAERALVARSPAFRTERIRESADLNQVRRALPPGAALVGYMTFPRVTPPDPSLVPAYLAFVLPPGATRPILVPLGGAADIDAAVQRWREEVARDPRSDPTIAETRYRDAARRLRELAWDPIAVHLGHPDLVIVVPDGALQLVSFATLPTTDGRYLAQSVAFHYLSSEEDIVGPRRRGPASGLLAIGGPDFDAVLKPERDTRIAQAVQRGPLATCANLRSLQYQPLPGARSEVEEIASLYASRRRHTEDGNAVTLTGTEASETAFKRLAPDRDILHLATHAFFVDGDCRSDLDPDPDSSRGSHDPKRPAARLQESPLILSGLILAGANRAADDPGGTTADDGYLTAEEIGALDLERVRWAVLSACTTGVGHVHAGEEVLGLRRAFQIAGAGTLIMSLWRVDDDSTRDYMRELYRARLDGATTYAAVRRAELAVFEDLRALGLPTHPHFWGAFVAIGDWR